MNLQDAFELIGKVDNASGQICQLNEDGKPVLILFEFGCPNCSEVANKNADDYGAAVELIVNRAAQLYEACGAAYNALRSYQHGNTAPELEQEIADHLQEVIAKARAS